MSSNVECVFVVLSKITNDVFMGRTQFVNSMKLVIIHMKLIVYNAADYLYYPRPDDVK